MGLICCALPEWSWEGERGPVEHRRRKVEWVRSRSQYVHTAGQQWEAGSERRGGVHGIMCTFLILEVPRWSF